MTSAPVLPRPAPPAARPGDRPDRSGSARRNARSRLWAWLRPLGGLAILAFLVWRLGTGPFLDALRADRRLVARGRVRHRHADHGVLGLALEHDRRRSRAATPAADGRRGLLPLDLPQLDAARRRARRRAPGGQPRARGRRRRPGRAGCVLGAHGRTGRAGRAGRGRAVGVPVAGAVLDAAGHRDRARCGRAGRAAGPPCCRGAGCPAGRCGLRTARADVRDGLLARRIWPRVLLASVVAVLGHAPRSWSRRTPPARTHR